MFIKVHVNYVLILNDSDSTLHHDYDFLFYFRRPLNDHESEDLANLLFVVTRGLSVPNFK